jgi:hypothetical protein
VNIGRESLQVRQELVLLRRWVELDESHIGLEGFIGIPSTKETLAEETESAGNPVRSSTGQGGSYTLP